MKYKPSYNYLTQLLLSILIGKGDMTLLPHETVGCLEWSVGVFPLGLAKEWVGDEVSWVEPFRNLVCYSNFVNGFVISFVKLMASKVV